MSEWGTEIRESRQSERRDRFEETVAEEIESAWTAYFEGEYHRAVRLSLRLFFRMSEQPYSPWRFTRDLDCTGEEYAALFEIVDEFEEQLAIHNRVCVESDGTVQRPVEALEFCETGTLWEQFRGYSDVRPAEIRLEWALSLVEAVAVEREIIGEPGEPTHRLGEDFEESPLYDLWKGRQEDSRTIAVLVVARDGATGVGKTTLAVQLCQEFDGDWTAEKATNRAYEYRELLRTENKGSVLLADEFATMWDARRAMSTANVEASQDWQMLRKLQVSTVGTTPSMSAVDSRFLTYMDIQIVVTRRGMGRVYKLKEDDQDGSLYREHLCNVEWGAMDDDEDYQEIEAMKLEKLEERLRGDDGRDQEDDEIDEDTRREVRNEIIRELAAGEMTQTEIAEALELTPSSVSKIVNQSD